MRLLAGGKGPASGDNPGTILSLSAHHVNGLKIFAYALLTDNPVTKVVSSETGCEHSPGFAYLFEYLIASDPFASQCQNDLPLLSLLNTRGWGQRLRHPVLEGRSALPFPQKHPVVTPAFAPVCSRLTTFVDKRDKKNVDILVFSELLSDGT